MNIPWLAARLAGVLLVLPAVSADGLCAEWTKPDADERRRLERLAAEDRRRLMQVLEVEEPRDLPDEDADPKRPQGTRRAKATDTHWWDEARQIVLRSSWGNWVNYDLARADRGMPVPDPLVSKDGRKVTDAETWWKVRRPEIVQSFVSEIYGHVPAGAPPVSWETVEQDEGALNGAARRLRLVGRIDNSAHPEAHPRIDLELFIPASSAGPVPVVVTVGGIWPTPVPGPREWVLARGWAYGTFMPYSLQEDTGGRLTEGVIGLVNRGRPRTPEQWGAIAAWAWGLSRIVDHLETWPELDVRRLAVQGHSRFGKTALVAAALDSRWVATYVSCSGAGGAKLFRHDFGESLDLVASPGAYHWMAGNFLKYGGRWQDLPVDQHELIALVAPRAVFITAGTEDLWADPVGMFRACVAAGPVFRLLGQRDLDTIPFPEPDVTVGDGSLAFRLHAGGHSDVPDWPQFLDFAERAFRRPIDLR